MSNELRVDCVACNSSFVSDDTTLVKRDWPENPGGWLVGVACPVCNVFTLSYRMTPELDAQRVSLADLRAEYRERRTDKLLVRLQRKQKQYQDAFDAVQGKG